MKFYLETLEKTAVLLCFLTRQKSMTITNHFKGAAASFMCVTAEKQNS